MCESKNLEGKTQNETDFKNDTQTRTQTNKHTEAVLDRQFPHGRVVLLLNSANDAVP